jgi:large subunit ribosomal protein L21
MYAIVEIGGQQFKVETGKKLYINLVQAEEGDLLSFDRVLLLENEGDIKVGTPVVDGASIKVKVLGEVKGDKVIVFKKKRRKTYRKKNGHRQRYTQVLIEEIVA